VSSLTTEFVRLRGDSLATIKGHIRPLVEGDVAQIRDLWIRAGGKAVPSSASLLKRLFFDSPWSDSAFSSLAYEDAGGRLLGCLGVTFRPMVFQQRSIRTVVGHNFMVDASRQGARAGIELARRFLAGPQDLSLAVWNDYGRRIWTSLGGTVTPFHSLCWTRALRPAQNILRTLRHQGLPLSAAVTLYPACQAVDATLSLFEKRVLPVSAAASPLSDDLDAVTMLSYLTAFAGDRALKPCYNVTTLSWLLDTLGEQSGQRGRLHKVAVRTRSGRPLGWYLYHLGASGAAEVLQVGGKDDALRDVLDHLFDHARQRGAVAVTGSMDARLVGALSEKYCAFHRPRNTWALFHSRDARIAEAIHSGDAFLSRLEGSSWTEIEA
jgi:hypothetical protein